MPCTLSSSTRNDAKAADTPYDRAKKYGVRKPAPNSWRHEFGVELLASSPAGLRAQTTAAADEALQQGHNVLALGLDSLPVVDDAVVSSVIVALRTMHASGGEIHLTTSNPHHRGKLLLNGLDQIVSVSPANLSESA